VTLVSTGKGDIGAAKLTGEILEIVEKLPKVVETMTGIDIGKVS
jgi:flotillin